VQAASAMNAVATPAESDPGRSFVIFVVLI